MLCNCLLMRKDGFVRPCLATITGGMNLGIFFVPAHDYGRWWYDWTYQLPPYSKVVHTLDGHENMKGFTYWYIYIYIFVYIYIYIYIFFLAVVVLGVLLSIDCLMAAWHISWPRVWFRLAGGSYFRWKPFQVSRIFQGKTFWFLAFLFYFLFFTSSPSLCDWLLWLPELRILLLVFSVSSLISRYALYLRSFPFWILLVFLSFEFLFSFYASLSPFRVVLFPLMVGYSEVKRTSPFIAFLFARLGALVESSSNPLGAFSSSDSYP